MFLYFRITFTFVTENNICEVYVELRKLQKGNEDGKRFNQQTN